MTAMDQTERVARAIYSVTARATKWEDLGIYLQDSIKREARAAMRAMRGEGQHS